MQRAVFFDRDGVLNKLVERYLRKYAQMELLLTSPWSLQELEIYHGIARVVADVKRKGFLAFIVTNQPGLENEEIPESVYDCMSAKFMHFGFNKIYTCRHKLGSTCNCQKPNDGLLQQAATEWRIDLAASYVIGDSKTDVQAAEKAGCRGYLLRTLHNVGVEAQNEVGTLGEFVKILH